MLIINADDFGGWRSATDAALRCSRGGRITSVTAMVFMEDSERAAEMVREDSIDVGLHINFNQPYTGAEIAPSVREAHERVRRYLGSCKYAQVMYNPWVKAAFQLVYRSQWDEFVRLYECEPSHLDGHQHMHLCANVLLDGLIGEGKKVRRSFSFEPGEKSIFNRCYRRWVDHVLARRHVVTDYFFALSQCLGGARIDRASSLARSADVELMTHPECPTEMDWLLSDEFGRTFQGLQMGTYSEIGRTETGVR